MLSNAKSNWQKVLNDFFSILHYILKFPNFMKKSMSELIFQKNWMYSIARGGSSSLGVLGSGCLLFNLNSFDLNLVRKYG